VPPCKSDHFRQRAVVVKSPAPIAPRAARRRPRTHIETERLRRFARPAAARAPASLRRYAAVNSLMVSVPVSREGRAGKACSSIARENGRDDWAARRSWIRTPSGFWWRALQVRMHRGLARCAANCGGSWRNSRSASLKMPRRRVNPGGTAKDVRMAATMLHAEKITV